ncbi:MAG TPA: hypothetical protein VFB72_05425 [Verrucomicrobiae bacterium]|nr:hypothetical protein [Verrucomicrobiae bacterium]
MPTETKKYRRMPGTGMGYALRSTLWLGEDHLLSIRSSGYSEDYKRFYFGDIQAIVIRQTQTGRIINGVLSAFAVVSLMAALTTSAGVNIFWYIVTGVFVSFLLLNTLLGPTCVTHLRTAVQSEDLQSLRRLHRARKVLARMRPLIARAQGQLSPAEIPARMTELAKPPVQSTPAATTATAPDAHAAAPTTATQPSAPQSQ